MHWSKLAQASCAFNVFFCLAISPIAFGQTKTITAEATYTMGDGETPSFAEAMVLQKAKQTALDQAGTYVESYTKVRNYALTTDEIQTIAGGVLQVEVLEKKRELIGDGMRHYVKINATVTTDQVAKLAERIKGINVTEDYKQLRKEYSQLAKEIETWKQLVTKTPVGPERERALDQIRQREKLFARLQENEKTLIHRLVSGETLITEAHDDQTAIDKLMDSIKTDGHVIAIGKVKAFPPSDRKDEYTIAIPIILQPSTTLPAMLTDTSRSLGGEEVESLSLAALAEKEKGSGLEGLEARLEVHHRKLQKFLTIRYSLPKESIDYSRVSVESAPPKPNSPHDLIPFDNLYRGTKTYFHGDYAIGTPGTMVKVSHTRPIDDYFRERVRNLRLVVELYYEDSRLKPPSCRVPTIVNRLIAAIDNKSSSSLEPKFSVTGFSSTSVLLLFAPVSFSVEFDLPSIKAKNVRQVTTQWKDLANAPSETCRIFVEQNQILSP